MELRHDKRNKAIKKLAAEFIETQSNQTSLITVTNVSLSPDLKKATIFITVLGDATEAGVIDFLKRKRGEMREYIGKHAKMGTIPFLDVEIDEGEKNRQRIDGLLKE